MRNEWHILQYDFYFFLSRSLPEIASFTLVLSCAIAQTVDSDHFGS